jgi:hypothetical protein
MFTVRYPSSGGHCGKPLYPRDRYLKLLPPNRAPASSRRGERPHTV